MTKHLPECPVAAARPGTFTSCICDALRACEERVRFDEPRMFTPDENANNICEAFRLGLAAARESVESQWTEDPSWDGTNWNNALTSALAAIDAPREK